MESRDGTREQKTACRIFRETNFLCASLCPEFGQGMVAALVISSSVPVRLPQRDGRVAV